MLARFDGGVVRASDLAREARFAPRDELQYRDAVGHDAARRTRDWARREALRRIALREAEAAGLMADAELRARARRAGREWLLARREADCHGQALPPVDAAALRAEVEANLPVLPRRLRLSHLFLRAQGAAERAQAETRLRAIVAEAPDLDRFRALARAQSESESAAKGGAIGVVWPGFLDPEAERALGGAGPGLWPQPVALRGGVHLFFVEQVLEAGPADAGQRLQRRIGEAEARRRAECRARALAADATPVVQAADGTIQVGTWRLPRAAALAGLARSDESEAAALARYVESERLFQRALADPALAADERARVADLEAAVWLDALIAAEIGQRLGAPAAGELEAAFAAQERPLLRREHLAFTRLELAIPASAVDPLALREALLAGARALAEGRQDWAALQAALPVPSVRQSWPATDIWRIAEVFGPPTLEALRALEPGALASPLREERRFSLLRLDAREAARPLSFAEARPQLLARWQAQRTRSLRAGIAAELLRTHGFVWLGDADDAASTEPQPDRETMDDAEA